MFLRKVLLSLVCGLSLLITIPSQAKDTLGSEDKKQIEQIVHDYLLKNPQLLVEMSQSLQQNHIEQFKLMEEKARAVIPGQAKNLLNASSVGHNPQGKISLVEFFDYQCQHCKDVNAMVSNIQTEDRDLRVVYKELPIFGGDSVYAAKAALAAQKQGKYLEFHDALMAIQKPLSQSLILTTATQVGLNKDQLKKDMNSAMVDQELKSNMQLARKLGITGTPSFVLVKTTKPGEDKEKTFFIPGATDQNTLTTLIARVRQ